MGLPRKHLTRLKRDLLSLSPIAAILVSGAGAAGATNMLRPASITSAVVQRTAHCPRSGPQWRFCGPFSRTIRSSSEAQKLYDKLANLALVDLGAIHRHRLRHDGRPPASYCPADATRTVLRITFKTTTTSRVAVLQPNGAGTCTEAAFQRRGRSQLRFTAYGISHSLIGYLQLLSHDIRIAPRQLCPRSAAAAKQNICGLPR